MDTVHLHKSRHNLSSYFLIAFVPILVFLAVFIATLTLVSKSKTETLGISTSIEETGQK